MAVHAGPKINDDGLVLALDASNERSYPGTGTTWSDLSGNGNNGTLTNAPTFTADKRMVFDGSNDYVAMGASESTNIRGSLTVSMWAKSNYTSSVGWNTVWCGVSKYNQFILGPNAVNGKMAFLVHSGTWYPTNYSSAIWGQTTIDPREYHYYVGTYNQSTGIISVHVDGVVEYSSNIGVRTLDNDLAGFAIAKRDVSGNFLNAEIPKVDIYNRALSTAEIKQNFEATRDRYGI